MAITTVVMEDTPEFTWFRDFDDVAKCSVDRVVHKAGSEGFNREQILTKLMQARQMFKDNYTNWPTMNATAKDTAARNVQRAMANVLRFVLEDFTDVGA